MSTEEYKEYLDSCSYAELRQLAIEQNVWKAGSRKREALIKKLLKHQGHNESLESDFEENCTNFDKDNSNEISNKRLTYTIDDNKKQILNISNEPLSESPEVAMPKRGRKSKKNKKVEKENLSPVLKFNNFNDLTISNDTTDVNDRRLTTVVESKKPRGRRGVNNDAGKLSNDIIVSQNDLSGKKEIKPKGVFKKVSEVNGELIAEGVPVSPLDSAGIQNRRETYSAGRKRKHTSSTHDSPLTTTDSCEKLPIKKKRNMIKGISTPVRSSPRITSTSVTSSAKNIKGSLLSTPVNLKESIINFGSPGDQIISKEKAAKNKKLNVTFTCDSSGSLKSMTPSRSLLFNNVRKTPRKVVNVTPMKSTTPKSKNNVTPHQMKKVKTPGSSFSARKMPNFAEIHKRNFAHMESLPSYTERKANRALSLLSPVSLSKSICLGSALSDSQTQNKLVKRSNIPIRKKMSINRENEPPSDAKLSIKDRPINVQYLREKNRAIIKGVRINRRFELQMQLRNLLNDTEKK